MSHKDLSETRCIILPDEDIHNFISNAVLFPKEKQKRVHLFSFLYVCVQLYAYTDVVIVFRILLKSEIHFLNEEKMRISAFLKCD